MLRRPMWNSIRCWLSFNRWTRIYRRSPQGEVALPHPALLVEDDANESELLAGFLRLSGFSRGSGV